MTLSVHPANVLRLLLPSKGLKPHAVGVTLLWYVASCMTLVYLLFLPAVVFPGVDLSQLTALYLAASAASLTTILAALTAGWILYTYLFALLVPTVHGHSLTSVVLLAGESLLRALRRLVTMCWAVFRTSGQFPMPTLQLSPLQGRMKSGLSSHLASGWDAGTNPQLLYAPLR